MLDGTAQDLRYALRLLRRNPLFALTAVLSLAVGIGANTTIFTIVNALLLRPPAGIADPARLVDIGRSQNGKGFDTNSYPNYLDIRSRSVAFAGSVYAARVDPQPMSLGGGNGAERVYGAPVSANYFTVLGATAHVGRVFTLQDGEEAGATPLVVISHKLWARRFSADPRIVGQTMMLNGHPFTVVGVAPAGFHGTTILAPDLWVPLTMVRDVMPRVAAGILTSRASVWLVLGARLKPGVTVRQAQAELLLLGQALERENPTQNRGKGLAVTPSAAVPGQTATVAAFMALLMGIVGLVLLIACVNLTGVLLARAASRRREIAVRLAVGAGRARLIRQLLTETLILFLLGAAAGLVLARGMTTMLLGVLPALPFPVDVSLALDARVIAFTFGLSLAAAVISGLVPAFAASKADLVSNLKDDQQGPGRLRLRHAFVVGQVALSLLLVVGGGLFLRALQRAGSIDPGFDARGVELTALDLSIGGYDETRGRIFAHQLIERVRAIAGVEAASIAAVMPLGGSGMGLGGLSVPGVTRPRSEEFADADWNVVEPRYFATMRLPLVAGRDFTDADRADAPGVAIVNETLARTFWPGQDALGKELLHDSGRTPAGAPIVRHMIVVGVARDGKYRSLDDRSRMFIFVPLGQQYVSRLTILARAAGGRRVQSDVRALLAQMDPNLPIVRAQTFEDHAALGLIPQRVAASVSGSLGVVGLLLAAIGIYGVTAYAVARRTREIGIRMALGAQQRDVVRMVLRQGMTLALGGVGIGLVLAAGASRLLTGLLLGIPPLDAVTFIGAALLFALVGIIACFVPARRATRIDAMEALRYE